MTKPFNVNELRARLRAGERVVALHQKLDQALLQMARLSAVIQSTERPADTGARARSGHSGPPPLPCVG